MSWKKHFKPVTIDGHGSHSPISGGGRPGPAKTNYSSFLPDVYAGTPNRIDRYMQYDTMDMDSEVNAALDIIAEFCTQKDKENETPFHTSFRGQPTSTEVKLIKDCLQKWCKQQQFETRIFRIIRNTFKYGDCFFLRDPETKKWLYVDPVKVSKIIANESEGKIPEQYVIKDINFNFKNLIAVTPHGITNTSPSGTASYTSGGSLARGMVGDTARSTGTRFQNAINEIAVDAKDVVHISLSEGLDNNFPFGNSLLESVFKVYKQKELLEDAVIIYRIQRAPERLVFYVDVGNMPAHLAMGFVERVKNEIQQRRIPSSGGSAGSTVDSSYNPLSVGENFYLPSTSEGRGSRVETLPGGCFAMDTKVSLLDGRELSIRDIETELKDGKTLWTYSCEPITGKIVPGLITWAGVTQKSAKVMKITLDNGEHMICTPDHKFPVYEQEYKRAEEFKVGDSLIPLYRRMEPISTNIGSNTYEQYFDNADKKWKFTHKLVADYLKDDIVKFEVYDPEVSNGLYEVRHHKNFNRYDNSPENLCFMGFKDHAKFHTEQVALVRASKTPEQQAEWNNNISIGLKAYCANLSPEEKEIRDTNSRAAFVIGNQKFNEKMQNDPEFYADVVGKRMEHWTEENRAERSALMTEIRKEVVTRPSFKQKVREHADSQQMKFSHDMLKEVIRLVKGKSSHQVGLTDVENSLNSNQEMLDQLAELNQKNKTANWKIEDGFTESGIKGMVKQFGYERWSDFRKKESIHNHTIVAIEYLDDEIEVGTLTIDNDERYHDYHNFALSIGIISQNSQTGEITDLRYFTNKLFRALRIPASYLPTGIEEASNTVADGKVGTAYIQEFRFNEYCKRLQNLLVQTFDLEFKLWLYSQGINIDSSLFELKFNEPQNFAAYRQSELDTTRVNIFAQLQEIPYLSKRFAMKRFLGMTQEEITENEAMWREENGHTLESLVDGAGELRSAGISPSGIASDMSAQDEMAPEVPGGPEGSTGGANVAPGPMGNAAPGTTGGPMGM